jgi:glycosyltransferase involved in cell wall biosynthesis
MDARDVWVVLPAYDEKGVEKIIESIKRYTSNIILVDDGSKEVSYKNTEAPVLIRHKANYGKGAALRSGCDYAFFRKNAKAVILMDSDGQHEASSIPNFLYYLSKYDMVYGSRELSHPMPLIRRLSNKFISSVLNSLFKTQITDVLSGFRAMTRKAYFRIRWSNNRFNVEAEIIINAAIKDIPYTEVRIPTLYFREGNVGTKIGFTILFYILMRRIFYEDFDCQPYKV